MKNVKLIAALALGVSAMAMPAAASAATLITFEGLAAGTAVTTQYQSQGVTFSNATILKYPNYNYPSYPAHSGVNVIYNPSADITLNFSSLVSNVSAYASTTYNLTLSAFNAGGTLIGTSTLAPNLGNSSLISFAGPGIASVKFSNGDSNQLTLDDISFDVMPAVPEPATWAMMIIGVGAVGFAMRRTRKAKVATTVRFA